MTEFEERMVAGLARMEAVEAGIVDIKGTMGKVADALTRLAVIERDAQRGAQDQSRVFSLLDDHDQRLRTLEMAQPAQKQTTDWFNKVLWIAVGALVAAVVSTVVFNRGSDTHGMNIPGVSAPR